MVAVAGTLLLSILLSSCHPPLTPSALATMRIDTLWYASSRQRVNGRLGHHEADSLEFGYYRIASARGVDAARDPLDIRIIDSTRLTEPAFMAEIAKPSRDTANVVVVTVHGYGTDHRKALLDGAESLVRSGSRGRWIVYSWPSRGLGLNLMDLSSSLFTGAYRADAGAAAASGPRLATFLLALHDMVGGSRLVLLTHSLGARVVGEMFMPDSAVHHPLREALQADPLRAAGFFAADISQKYFVSHLIPNVAAISKRVGSYASRDDASLQFSQLVNGSKRAGLISDRPITMFGLETIDITDASTSENWWRRIFTTHHGMRRESEALRDFFNVLVAGRPAESRSNNGSAELQADGSWKLQPVPRR